MEFEMRIFYLLYCSSLRVVTCPTLYAPYNGMINCSPEDHAPTPEPSYPYYKRIYYYYYHSKSEDRSNVGDICTFTCQKDYVISGSDSRICKSDGAWSGTSASCESKYCNNYISVAYICTSYTMAMRDFADIYTHTLRAVGLRGKSAYIS